MKKITALFLSLIMVLAMCSAALASTGDKTVWYSASEEGYYSQSISKAMLVGNKVYVFLNGNNETLLVYDRDTETTSTYTLNINMYEEIGYREPEDEPVDETGELEDLDEENTDNKDTADEEEISAETVNNGWNEISLWFVYRDEVYAVITRSEYDYEENSSKIDGGEVRKLVINGETAELAECNLPKLDWSGMIESEDGGYEYTRYARYSGCNSETDRLYILTNDNTGNDMLLIYDLTDGFYEEKYMQNVNSLFPCPDGTLLISQYDWTTPQGSMRIGFYDPDSESTEIKADFVLGSGSPQNIYYRADNNTLYYTMSGEIWAAPDFDMSQAVSVNDCPIAWGEGNAQMTEDGFLLLYDYQSVILRNTDPGARQAINLHVMDYTYQNSLDSAYYDFTGSRGDVAVVISRYGSSRDVLQSMMNQDSTYDVYCMQVSDSAFSALYNRGFLAELDGSEKLTAYVNSLYPNAANAVKKDGHIVAVPLYAYGSSIGINLRAFEKLGYTRDQLPTTWEGYLDLLEELPSKTEGSGVVAFMPWYSIQSLKSNLFMSILSSYQDYLNDGGDSNFAFNTPILQKLVDRLENLDYLALGVMEEEEDEEGGSFSFDWDNTAVLMETSVESTVSSYRNDYEPLLLSFDGEERSGTYNMTVAFVNPYSTHQQEAIAYLESAVKFVPMASRYSMSPENNEPARYPYYEENMKSYSQDLEQARKNLEQAVDPDMAADWQETVKMIEDQISEMEKNDWMISPEAIEAYQARAQYMKPSTYDFFNLITSSEDSSIYDALSRFYEGETTAQELLQILDQKYQMMRLEGN